MTAEPTIEVIEPRLYAASVADELVASIQDAIHERGRCSLVLSGGSTPSAVYRCLAMPPRVESVEWGKVDLFWGDERWVSHEDTQSNFLMVRETLLAHLGSNGPRVHPVDTTSPTPQVAAERYTRTIAETLGTAPDAVPEFDIVLLGVGEDAHTASIFPGSPLVHASGAVPSATCVAVKDASGEKDRITLSPNALFAARRIMFLVKGASKAEVVQRVLRGSESFDRAPARLYITAPAERVTWFLDSEAAVQLDRRA